MTWFPVASGTWYRYVWLPNGPQGWVAVYDTMLGLNTKFVSWVTSTTCPLTRPMPNPSPTPLMIRVESASVADQPEPVQNCHAAVGADAAPSTWPCDALARCRNLF